MANEGKDEQGNSGAHGASRNETPDARPVRGQGHPPGAQVVGATPPPGKQGGGGASSA